MTKWALNYFNKMIFKSLTISLGKLFDLKNIQNHTHLFQYSLPNIWLNQASPSANRPMADRLILARPILVCRTFCKEQSQRGLNTWYVIFSLKFNLFEILFFYRKLLKKFKICPFWANWNTPLLFKTACIVEAQKHDLAIFFLKMTPLNLDFV